jgi:hypothetical protein
MRTAIAACCVWICVGCAGERPAERAPSDQAATDATQQRAAPCPMDVPDTRVVAADTSDGGTLTFFAASATRSQLLDLRQRVRALAGMQDHYLAGPAAGGTGSGAPELGRMPPPTRVTMYELAQGVRLEVSAVDPSQADRVRNGLHAEADRLEREGCRTGR